MAVFSKHSQLSHQIDVKFDRQFPKTLLFHPHMQLSSFFIVCHFGTTFDIQLPPTLHHENFHFFRFRTHFCSNRIHFCPKSNQNRRWSRNHFRPYPTQLWKGLRIHQIRIAPIPVHEHRQPNPLHPTSAHILWLYYPRLDAWFNPPGGKGYIEARYETTNRIGEFKNPFPSTPTPSMRLWCT